MIFKTYAKFEYEIFLSLFSLIIECLRKLRDQFDCFSWMLETRLEFSIFYGNYFSIEWKNIKNINSSL